MLLFGRRFFFFFLSLSRLCFRPISLLTSKPMFLPRDAISPITAESSLSKPKSVRNSETQYFFRDALCLENLFVNRIVHDPRRL